MNQPENLHLINALPVGELAAAIDQWLAARNAHEMEPSDESEYNYNATYYSLGEAFAEHYPEAAAKMPDAFDWYRRGLIAPEEDE